MYLGASLSFKQDLPLYMTIELSCYSLLWTKTQYCLFCLLYHIVGEFGSVYKAKLRGEVVAVKILKGIEKVSIL